MGWEFFEWVSLGEESLGDFEEGGFSLGGAERRRKGREGN
jgi:hypothetical protein